MSKISLSESEWKERLDNETYYVCRQSGTEPAFSGEYWDCHKEGVYHCAACDAPLFSSETKYDSGSGWPSFFKAIDASMLTLDEDNSHQMHRTEVRCGQCDSHLGHLFDDGPNPTGLRFCINSRALLLHEKITQS
jgi:peptide-methionine (R)-S-oxide reductase